MGYRTYNFPTEKRRRALWTQNVNRANWEPSRSSRLCEVHFEVDHFELGRKDGKKLLKPYATPTLFGKNIRKTKLPNKARKQAKTPKSDLVASQHDHCYKLTSISPPNSPLRMRKPDSPVGDSYYVCEEVENQGCGPHIINDSSNNSSGDICSVSVTENYVSLSPQQKPRTYARISQEDRLAAVPCDGLCVEKIEKLKMANNNLTKQLAKEREKATILEANLKSIFNEDQLEALSSCELQTWKHITWQEDTLQRCLEMKCVLGQKAYDYLRASGFPLPSSHTLMRRIDKLQYRAETLTEEPDDSSSCNESLLDSSVDAEEMLIFY